MSRLCKFYLQGNCNYGSSCRFLHSDNGSSRYDNQYDSNESRYNRSTSGQYSDDNYNQSDTKSDKGNYRSYNQHKYQSDSKNRNYSSKNDYKNKNIVFNHYEEDSYRGNRNKYKSKNEYEVDHYYAKDDYSSKGNTDYTRRHENANEFDYKPRKEYKMKNHYDENYYSNEKTDFTKRNYRDNNELDNQSKNRNIQEYFTNFKPNSNKNRYNDDSKSHMDSQYKYMGHNSNNRKEYMLTLYQEEIKVYKSHIQEQLDINMWPFTCYQPIGNIFPIQPVGSLNFIEASFEEIRCDYYLIKNISANPELIHKQMFEDLVLKARNQRKIILSFTENVQDDIMATFEKCEQSKTDSEFQNHIMPDNNSYWNMSIRHLQVEVSKSEMESFSFVPNKEKNHNTNNVQSLKIMMQNDVYGRMDCDAYTEDMFTDYIPIIPPSINQCF